MKVNEKRLEAIVAGEAEAENELEVLFVEANRQGRKLVGPMKAFVALCDRFPEINTMEVQAFLLGYEIGSIEGAERVILDELDREDVLAEFIDAEKKGRVQ